MKKSNLIKLLALSSTMISFNVLAGTVCQEASQRFSNLKTGYSHIDVVSSTGQKVAEVQGLRQVGEGFYPTVAIMINGTLQPVNPAKEEMTLSFKEDGVNCKVTLNVGNKTSVAQLFNKKSITIDVNGNVVSSSKVRGQTIALSNVIKVPTTAVASYGGFTSAEDKGYVRAKHSGVPAYSYGTDPELIKAIEASKKEGFKM